MQGMRTVAAALAALGSMLVLGGCVTISSTGSSQATHAGPVKLGVTMCATGAPGCTDTAGSGTNSGSIYEFISNDTDTFAFQSLYAARLPDTTTVPDSFPSTPGSGRFSTTFTRSASLESELQTLEPAPTGTRWFGYLSGELTYSKQGPQFIVAEITVPIPRPAEGPFVTPMKWRPVAGVRFVSPELPASRAVECGETNTELYEGSKEGGSSVTSVCVDSPTPSAARGFIDAPTRDFGITGTTATIPAGGTSTVTYFAVWSGTAEANQTYDLAIAGGPPGATLSIDRASVTPAAESTTPVLATVGVPAGTSPGVYDLTVSASRAGKDTRIGTAKVTVPAPAATPTPSATPSPTPVVDTTKPRITGAKLTPAKPRTGRSAALALTLSENAAVLVTVERAGSGRTLGKRCSATARKGKRCTRWTSVGTVRATLIAGARRLTLPAKLKGRTLRRGRHRLRIVATDAARNASAATTVTFTVAT